MREFLFYFAEMTDRFRRLSYLSWWCARITVWNLQWSVCIRLLPVSFYFLLYTYIRRRRLYAWDNWILSAYIYRARAWPRRRRQPLRQHVHSSLSRFVYTILFLLPTWNDERESGGKLVMSCTSFPADVNSRPSLPEYTTGYSFIFFPSSVDNLDERST